MHNADVASRRWCPDCLADYCVADQPRCPTCQGSHNRAHAPNTLPLNGNHVLTPPVLPIGQARRSGPYPSSRLPLDLSELDADLLAQLGVIE